LRKLRRNKPHILPRKRTIARARQLASTAMTDVLAADGCRHEVRQASSTRRLERPLRRAPTARSCEARSTSCGSARSTSSTRVRGSPVHARGRSYSVKPTSSARARAIIPRTRSVAVSDDVPVAVYDGLIHRCGATSRRSSATKICAGACSVSTSCTLTTRTCRSWRRSRRTSASMKRSRRSSRRCSRSGRVRAHARDGLRNAGAIATRRKGKRSGAFSSGSYGAPPYILMNYKEDVFSTSTRSRTKRAFDAHLVLAEDAALSGLQLPDLPRGGRLDVQRGAPDALPARADRRPEDARLHHQPADR
jgi:hypothetical protein